MDAALREFATRYTAAWCSQNAASVAECFTEEGSLKINDGTPSVGRTAITAAAQSFMTAFPDMVVTMDGVSLDGDQAVYRWTLTGTNTGPDGTGNAVRISGYEEWTIGANGLIAESRGHFDEADYERQLNAGVRRSSTALPMNEVLRSAYVAELTAAEGARHRGEIERAFSHLARAHILSQHFTRRHVHVHWLMLKLGAEIRDWREVRGQLSRLFAAAIFSRIWVPAGNTGRANVSAMKPMPIPDDLQESLDGHRSAKPGSRA